MLRTLGLIRLDALPAPDVWHAGSAFTQHAVAPHSTVTVTLSAAGMRRGDVAGLALFERPYAWIGVLRGPQGFRVAQWDERTGDTRSVPLETPRVWLRAECDLAGSRARFCFSPDGTRFTRLGAPCLLGNDALASRGILCSLFACRIGEIDRDEKGGYADFDTFLVTTR